MEAPAHFSSAPNVKNDCTLVLNELFYFVCRVIPLRNLKYLATQKYIDAETLFLNNRFNGAVYNLGYAIEFLLKRKLSLTLGFNDGFPENNSELKKYYNNQLALFNSIGIGITLNQIQQIRNHKLQELLKFTGIESKIITRYFNEWSLVCSWNPEKRYQRENWNFKRTSDFIQSSKIILNQID